MSKRETLGLLEILTYPTVINGIHQSCYRAYHVLQTVLDLASVGTPHKVILALAKELMEIDPEEVNQKLGGNGMTDKDLLKAKAKEITDKIYAAYGSGTGVLFGIEARLRKSVEWIVKITLEHISWQSNEED